MFAVRPYLAIISNRILLRCLPLKGKATNSDEEPDPEVYREIKRTSMETSVENCWNQEHVLHLLEGHVRNICKIKNGLVVIRNGSGRDPRSFKFDYEYFLSCLSSSPSFFLCFIRFAALSPALFCSTFIELSSISIHQGA